MPELKLIELMLFMKWRKAMFTSCYLFYKFNKINKFTGLISDEKAALVVYNKVVIIHEIVWAIGIEKR